MIVFINKDNGMKKSILCVMLLIVCRSLSFGDIKHRFLVLDESRDSLVYIDENDSSADWSVPVPASERDVQLVGRNRVMVSRSDGFDEYDITTGAKVRSQSPAGVSGVQSCRRLPDGSTLLAAEGITIWKADSSGTVLRTISIPGMSTFRTMRISARGTFLLGSGADLVETDTNGLVIRRITVSGANNMYQALRLSDGTIYASAGYGSFIAKLDSSGNVLARFGGLPGPAGYRYYFFSAFQTLTNSNIVVTNWQGHGYNDGANGIGLIEFDTAGAIAWSWMDHRRVSSLHGVLVLDSVNTAVLNDDRNGVLAPVEDSTGATSSPGGSRASLKSGRGSVAVSAGPEGTLFEGLNRGGCERILIYDVLGKTCVNRLVGNQEAFLWDQKDQAGRKVSAGIYIASLVLKDRTRVNRVFMAVR